MTAHPFTVGVIATLSEARALMRKHRIHHLPVMSGKTLVGLVSMDDIHLAESIARFDPETAGVASAMEAPPLTVQIAASIEDVVSRMVADKREAALVLDGERVAGIFTTNDAMRALSQLLARRAHSAPPRPIPDY
jgi:CBS domain-containing protein